jgi:transcriptional regulator with XRE-family HTH domain
MTPEDLRLERGLTRQQLSDATAAAGHRVWHSQIRRLELGVHHLRGASIGACRRLAEALGVEYRTYLAAVRQAAGAAAARGGRGDRKWPQRIL